jgi:hypothetical protein
MTVQELINELLLIEDRDMTVFIRTLENWGCETVSHIEVVPECEGVGVAIWREN